MATSTRMHMRPLRIAASLCVAVSQYVASAQVQVAPAVAKQLAADQRAYRAARDMGDAGQRVEALRAFAKTYPDSVYAGHARQLALDILLEEFPARLPEIDETARAIVKAQNKGYDRWDQQMYMADELAGAGATGVDLALAEAWIAETDRQLTEEHFLAAQKELYRVTDTPLPAPAELHRQYQHKRAEVLLVLAHVALKQGRLTEAATWLDQSAALEPLTGELNYLRGEIALQQHRSAEALELFERACLLGELPAAQRKAMLMLYREANGGSDAGLEADLDRHYASLYPPAFHVPARTPANVAHTVLLELYTGAGCGPCVGADLALDALLGAYSRQEVVALALEEHIPLPDPLTNPSTAARAAVYGVRSTPSYVLDGKVLHLYGTDREGAAGLYKRLAQAIDAQAALPGAVHIRLANASIEVQTLSAEAEIAVEPEAVLRARTAAAAAHDADEDEDVSQDDYVAEEPTRQERNRGTAPAQVAPLPKLSLAFALVEDQVRYSGENGIRFHRMVVRAIDRANGVTLTPGLSTHASAMFHLDEVARANAAYLEAYEKKNDRFGPVTFLSRNTAMQSVHLSLAAWVEDSATHRVLEAAFLPVPAAQPAGSTAQAAEKETP